MSKITPEDRNQRPIAKPALQTGDLRAPKAPDTQDAKNSQAAQDGRAEAAEVAADRQARMAKTTGKVPPERSGLETEEKLEPGREANKAREGRRVKELDTADTTEEVLRPGIEEGDKARAEDAARLAEAQRLGVKIS